MPRKKKSEEQPQTQESTAEEKSKQPDANTTDTDEKKDNQVSDDTAEDAKEEAKTTEETGDSESAKTQESPRTERRKGDRRRGERRSGIDRRASAGRRKEDREPKQEPQPTKPDVLHRLFAKLIDLFIFAALYKMLDEVGGGMGLLYLAICDGVRNGASVGKWIIGLRVRTEVGKLATIKESILRNLTVVFAMGLLIIPAVGWILFLTLGLLVLAIETYFVFHDTRGLRIGDIVANTWVEELPRHED